MYKAYGSRRLAATVVYVLAQSGRTKCSKEDDKKPTSDFSAFINKLGDKDGDIVNKLKEAATGFSGDKPMDFSSMLDGTNVRKVFESGMPGEIGYGFMMGYCSGFCVKKVSRLIALGIGGAFISLQLLSYNGFINVNYEKVQKSVEGELDLNKDGKFGSDDIMIAYTKLQDILSFHMPTGGGFTAGFLMGVRS